MILEKQVQKVLRLKNDKLSNFDGQYLTAALEQVVKAENADVIIFSHDFTGKEVAPRLAARLKAGIVAGAVGDPSISGDSFTVKKNVFSGKATAVYSINSAKKIISLLPNSFPVTLTDTTPEIVDFDVNLDNVNSPVKVKEVKKDTAELNLPDAELVVSAGRGMKGPENWKMVEELAKELGAATACSSCGRYALASAPRTCWSDRCCNSSELVHCNWNFRSDPASCRSKRKQNYCGYQF